MYNVLFTSIPLCANRRDLYIQTTRFASERCEHRKQWINNAKNDEVDKPLKTVGKKNQMVARFGRKWNALRDYVYIFF